MSFSRVVLPLPLRPRRTTVSPALISSDIALTMSKVPEVEGAPEVPESLRVTLYVASRNWMVGFICNGFEA